MVGRHELNFDHFARPSQEEDFGTKHPGRFEPKQSTTSSTQPQQRIRAHVRGNASTQSIPTGAATNTVVIFDTVDFDTSGLLSSNGFKIPLTGKVTGAWRISVHITWDAAAAGFREVNILSNGTQIASDHHLGSNDQQSQNLSILVNDPTPGTVYTVAVNQTSGGPLNLLKEAVHTYFEIIHLW